jgi:CRP/FNR family transcriptional regulator, cyclic AMP receptor protein
MPETDAPALSGLRAVHLLRDLPEPVLAEVAAACRFRLFRARQGVISRDDLDRDCYFIVSGRVRVVALSPGGREVSFRDAGTGETIGEMAAIDGAPRSATVVALQDTLLARLSPDDLRGLLQRHWVIADRMLAHLARIARRLTERVYELSTLNVQQRLCAELLRLALADAASHDRSADNRIVLRPAPSHSELAGRISSYREQVTRELAELGRAGLVGREDGALVIEDLSRLAERIEAVRTTA